MRNIFIIAAFLMLPACHWLDKMRTAEPDPAVVKVDNTATKQSYERIDFESSRATTAERAKCEAAGGKVMIGGLRGWENCVQPYSDAGKACMDSSECMGRCYAEGEYPGMGEETDAGRCQPNDSPFGCRTEIENGRAMPTLCVD